MGLRLLTADDHPVVRSGIAALIANEPDITVVAEAGDGAEAIACYDLHRPDVVVMDLRMPRLSGVAATRAILAAHPEARIVAFTSFVGDADIYRALEAGVCGYLLKDAVGTQLIGAIRAAAAGRRVIPAPIAARLAEYTPRTDLTGREIEVLRLAARGFRNRDIAHVLLRSEETVKVHLKHVMAKLGARDRTEAVTIALRRGIIHLDD
ncbi:MAG: response regulator [Longimicrobiales bacterium]